MLSPPGDMNTTVKLFDYETMKVQAMEVTDVPGLVSVVIQRAKAAAPSAWQAYVWQVLDQAKLKLLMAELPEEIWPNKLTDPINQMKVTVLREAVAQLEAATTGDIAA